MAQNVLAVYPGTFDPITLGHGWWSPVWRMDVGP